MSDCKEQSVYTSLLEATDSQGVGPHTVSSWTLTGLHWLSEGSEMSAVQKTVDSVLHARGDSQGIVGTGQVLYH